MFFLFSKVAVRVRPLNGAEVEDSSCTEIVHVLDENVRVYIHTYIHTYILYLSRRSINGS